MTTDDPEIPDLTRLLHDMLHWLNDPQHRQSPHLPTVYERFAQEFTHAALKYRELAAWCRLTASTARGEDVPLTIYPQPGEDPADTARWQKWRVS